MRTSEWIILSVLSFLFVLAWVRPLAWRRRLAVTARSVLGAELILAVVYLEGIFPARAGEIVRDWLPAAFLLVVYWQVGEFFSGPNVALQDWLLRSDRSFFEAVFRGRPEPGVVLSSYLEFNYLLCYPVVPAGLAVLYLAGKADADAYWTVVLVPTYLSDLTVAFLPVLPPRAVEQEPPVRNPATPLRRLNLWVLRHGSIQVNTFPSAHVASTLATALAVLAQWPAAGIVFLVIAVSIAAAVVLGRYHYALDALLAAALALGWFLLFNAFLE